MTNICANVMVVYGPKEDLEDFLKRLKNAVNKYLSRQAIFHNHSRNFAIRFFLGCGYEEDELNDLTGFGPMWVSRWPEFVEESATKPAHVVFRFDTEQFPAFDAWNDLLKRCFPNLKQVTYAEESGTGYYYNTDTEGIFFPEE